VNNFFQQNKLVKSRWLAMYRWRPFCTPWSQVLQVWWTNRYRTSFLPLAFFIEMYWQFKPFQNTWK